ncbi:NAD(P)/FAD-dependent oxidoreductase [Arthrobacter sp. MI7-26]|uniref:flavin-containing monooxygenase n=1 Tax=Arthrobacter sp. MI7-26 TaxID=2993653 RepID=UPI00224977FB|nr:NAD(P)/FAD-dependent oxidoreductase [Arthrobacter sp. MI7-26]MCX2748278.1 NAD(P)/FAD-dependent oxidoreductase [Arthrobacter sp. MI7-26]
MDMNVEQVDTAVIGAGQAGLATGFHLKKEGQGFLILDSHARTGDVWRNRWDSLRLFTPAQHDSLPGLPFPANRGTFPSKDAMAEYLEAYASNWNFPVRHGVQVTGIERDDGRYRVQSSSGPILAKNVVVATGPNARPRIPAFAEALDPGIHQLHGAEYANPDSVPPGDVLVVGSGTSGVEIALELVSSHRTYIAGTPPFHVPGPVTRYAGGLWWLFIHNVMNRSTPIGRKVAVGFTKHGAPLIRASTKELDVAGVTRLPRLTGTHGGQPLLDDGQTLPVSTVIWATGYQPDFAWIQGLPADEDGWPLTCRGAVEQLPGLFFVGMPFQYGLTSGLVGGVGRDAEHVAGLIAGQAGASQD